MCFLWSKVLLCEMSRNTSGHKMSQVDCLITSSILFRNILKAAKDTFGNGFKKKFKMYFNKASLYIPLVCSWLTVQSHNCWSLPVCKIHTSVCSSSCLLSTISVAKQHIQVVAQGVQTVQEIHLHLQALIIAFGVCSFGLIQTRITQIWCHKGINESLFRWEFSGSFDSPSSKSSGIIQ